MLFFAHLQDVAGSRELSLTLPDGATVAAAAGVLAECGAGFAGLLSSARAAVNAEFADAATVLHDGDEVAWMPPMSGGGPMLTDAPIDLAALSERVEGPGYGAVVTFSGTVRNTARGRSVLYLEYEAYAPLAETQLARLVGEAEERWQVKCAVQHRLGRLEVGESSVGIAAAAAHRAEAFDACRWLLDTLKDTVPIWKHEYFRGGDHWVEGPNAVSAGTKTEEVP